MDTQRPLRGILCALLVVATAWSAAPRPNILLIVADDLGYGDVASFRGAAPWITPEPPPTGFSPPRTPRVDQLARSGRKLTSFYANCSVCSPTRAALLTGRYQHRTGVVNVLGQFESAMRAIARPGEVPFAGLPLSEITVAELLRTGGYRTGAFGKWHLGAMNTHHPMDQGFDEYVGAASGGGDNFSMKTAAGASYFYRGRTTTDAPGDVLADEAIQFKRRPAPKPFFAYLAFTAPHVPYIGPKDRKLANAWDEKNVTGPRTDLHQAYKDVIEGLDAAIGRIDDALTESHLAESTLVVFLSDNGPVDYGSCAPLRGRKTWLYEGGPRVPMIARWPGKIPAGSVTDAPAMTMDLLPTFAALAGCTVPTDRKIDGVDLTRLLLAGEPPAPRLLFWEKPTGVGMAHFDNRRWAVRDGAWKLQQERNGKALELYDLVTDPTEARNVAAQNPDTVARLEAAFRTWRQDVYSECPYDLASVIARLKAKGIIDAGPKDATR